MLAKLADAEKRFVEEVGIVFDKTGLPRMAGRIFGWLLICEPSYQSPAELTEALMVSRGSISTMTRFLLQIGLIERVGMPGERQDYFQISPDAWQRLIKRGLEDEIKMFHQLAERGLALWTDKTSSAPGWLAEMTKIHSVYSFLAQEFPRLMERWEKEHNGGHVKTR